MGGGGRWRGPAQGKNTLQWGEGGVWTPCKKPCTIPLNNRPPSNGLYICAPGGVPPPPLRRRRQGRGTRGRAQSDSHGRRHGGVPPLRAFGNVLPVPEKRPSCTWLALWARPREIDPGLLAGRLGWLAPLAAWLAGCAAAWLPGWLGARLAGLLAG